MAQYTFIIPDAVNNRFVSGFCRSHGFQQQVRDANGQLVANPQTRRQFIEQKIREFAVDSAKSGEINEAVEAARRAAQTVAGDITAS